MNALTRINIGDALVSRPSIAPAPRDQFDYTLVDDQMATQMHIAVTSIHRRTRAAIIDSGRDLLLIKAQLDHGMFTQWIKDAVGISPRSDEEWMVAAELVDKNAQCAVLPVAMVNALARPEAMRPGLIEATADGSITKATEIRERVRVQRAADDWAVRKAAIDAERAAAEAKVTPQTKKRRAEREAEQERQIAERKAQAQAAVEALRDEIGIEAMRKVAAASNGRRLYFWLALEKLAADPETQTNLGQV
jgi:hypothetical protein